MFAGCPFKIMEQPKFVYDGKWLKMRELRFRKSDSLPEQVLYYQNLLNEEIIIYYMVNSYRCIKNYQK